MSMYWNLKRKTDKKYIVIQHPLKIQRNLNLFGIKFCAGYGVVAEGSKEHLSLRKMPMFKKAKEFPLSFLKKAGFRTKDIQLIFGYDIYYHYLDAVGLGTDLKPLPKEEPEMVDEAQITELIEENKEELDALPDEMEEELVEEPEELEAATEELPELTTEEIIEVHRRDALCTFVKDDGTVCRGRRSKSSPSGYCFGHIKHDELRIDEQKSEE